MSVVFVVTPVIAAGGFPLLAAATAATAASMGLKALKGQSVVKEQVAVNSVDLDMDNVDAVAAGIRPDDALVFGDSRIRVTLARDPRGKVTIHVEGRGIADAELRQLGETFLNKVIQQYAYQKVATELKKKGFKIVQEQVAESQAIRLRFRKFE